MGSISRPASSQKGRWPLAAIAGSSTPISYSEISIFIFCSLGDFLEEKSPKTLDTVGVQPTVSKAFGFCGAGGVTRTPDLLITNQLLYRLSYTSIVRQSLTQPAGDVLYHKAFQSSTIFLSEPLRISDRIYTAYKQRKFG